MAVILYQPQCVKRNLCVLGRRGQNNLAKNDKHLLGTFVSIAAIMYKHMVKANVGLEQINGFSMLTKHDQSLCF